MKAKRKAPKEAPVIRAAAKLDSFIPGFLSTTNDPIEHLLSGTLAVSRAGIELAAREVVLQQQIDRALGLTAQQRVVLAHGPGLLKAVLLLCSLAKPFVARWRADALSKLAQQRTAKPKRKASPRRRAPK